MQLDPLLLSRLQWAWVIAWHILLPAFTVGLAAYIAVLEGLYFFTRKEIWVRISSFWMRIFAVSFGMGVVSGIIMPFQFGTNWSRFTDAAANIISPMMAYEGFMAFALEATFLGVLLFGRKLVPPWAHFFAAIMVSVGTLFSSFWILATNSWMQTPRGYQIMDGRFFPRNWTDIVFSPSFPYRLFHNDTAFFITTGFVVLGVGSWLISRGRSVAEARVMMRMALNLLIVLVPLQIYLGDLHGDNTLKYQPAKLAAIEGLWHTEAPMAERLFAIPDQTQQKNEYELAVPYLGSLILTHSWKGGVKGLDAWPADQWPPVWPVFFAFRIMVGIAMLMLAVVVVGWVLRLRGTLYDTRWFIRLCQWFAPAGFVAVLMGWTTTEVGRQPWTVYGLMRTADSVTPSLTGGDVLASLLLYIVVYLLMYPTGLAYMASLVRAGVEPGQVEGAQIESGRPKEPFTTAAGRLG
jgi:cytochrome bd ubiquinol oxidase subunit I